MIDGGRGVDRLLGGFGQDSVAGGEGDVWLEGNQGADNLDGGRGNDLIAGGSSDDRLIGGGGMDSLTGGDGRDVLVVTKDGQKEVIVDFSAIDDAIDVAAFSRLTADPRLGKAGRRRRRHKARPRYNRDTAGCRAGRLVV
jgi:Ca2+-binding RTX toxin-like protein